MDDNRSGRRDEVGELLEVLGDERRCAVVSFFRECPGEAASVETLASVLCERDGASRERVALGLHHVTLPALEESGLLEYDDEKAVRYRGPPEMERPVEAVPAL